MKNILIAAAIVGIVVAGAIIFMTNDDGVADELEDAADEAGEAAHDAWHTMDKTIHKVERKTTPVLN